MYNNTSFHGGRETQTPLSKKRKVDRACDGCRRRKIRCDGPKMHDLVCTNCLQAEKTCTYLEDSKPRGPPKAYVDAMENKMEQLEALLLQLRPEGDFTEELSPPVVRDSWREELCDFGDGQINTWPLKTLVNGRTTSSIPLALTSISPPKAHIVPEFHAQVPVQTPDTGTHNCSVAAESPSSFDVIEIESISGLTQKLTLRALETTTQRPSSAYARFHGNSSSVCLVEATRKFKMMHILDVSERDQASNHVSRDDSSTTFPSTHRSQYWSIPPRERDWEVMHLDAPELIPDILTVFPPSELAEYLIDLYFCHSNNTIPLLHRPTFVHQWKENFHHKHVWFAAVCLGIFALASRWCNDPRVFSDKPIKLPNANRQPPGWKFLEAGIALHELRRRLFYPATLFEIQSFALFGLYLIGTPYHSLIWMVVGSGIRKAQDVGAHRENVYHDEPTVDEELWKRAFWCLVVLDRLECASLGRACSVGEEDFDIALPIEVDDQYWENADHKLDFKQPRHQPAQVCFFNQLIKLSRILAFVLKTSYSNGKSKLLFGLSPEEWGEKITAQVNAALKEWLGSLPAHLMWTNEQQQSSGTGADIAMLQSMYHLVRILLHQPFIPFPFSPVFADVSSETTWLPVHMATALDTCVDSARAYVRICGMHNTEHQLLWPLRIYIARVCSVILLVKIWIIEPGRMMSGIKAEDIKPFHFLQSLLEDLHALIRVLDKRDPQWPADLTYA